MKNYTTMGSVEVYYDFLSGEQAQNIIDSLEEIDQAEGFPAGFEDAKVGKGHKGGDIRSNSFFIFISATRYDRKRVCRSKN